MGCRLRITETSSMYKIIVSHKRAAKVITHNALAGCAVCVAKSQLPLYKEYHPDVEYVVHPDSLLGSSPKREWIFRKFGDVFMIDDDVMAFGRVYKNGNENKNLTPQEASDLIDDTYELCKQIGVKLFGFNRTNSPVGYNGSRPISLTEFVTGGAYGLIKDDKIYFPDIPDFVGDDYFLNGINAYYHRWMWNDQRFTVYFKQTEHGVGGVAEYRTVEKRKEAYILLKKYFGDAIRPKMPTQLKKHLNEYEKTLLIPF